MDRSAVKAIVEAHLDEYKEMLGIAQWHVVVEFNLRDDDARATVAGECTWYIDYERAVIRLDPDALDTEEEVLDTLRHELFHILLAPFTIFWCAVEPLFKGDATTRASLHSVRIHAVERCLINIERMYKKLTHRVPEPCPPSSAPSSAPAAPA